MKTTSQEGNEMSFVIYHKESTRYLDSLGGKRFHGSTTAAKRMLTLMAKADESISKDDYAIADSIEFHNDIEKMVTRVNLMSRKEYEERANTPIYCSPAFESYWSM
jgi:hypothetical protein